MTLVRVSYNRYKDQDTNIYYDFIFDYAVSLEAAEHFVEEHRRASQDQIESGDYFRKIYAIPQTSFLEETPPDEGGEEPK